MTPIYFASSAEFYAWLDEHHDSAPELWVGFHKKGSGQPSITWAEAVDQALCFGWIDGVRKRVDDQRYAIRFTPRRPRSIWSAVNIARVPELEALGMMRPAGLAAFAARTEGRSNLYAYEQGDEVALGEDFERQFRADERAWAFFGAQAAWYRKTAVWWVVSAKQDATRRRRLATLIEDSSQGRTVAPLTRHPKADDAG
ncbi:MAG: putative periplasmic membrane protein [uncultured Thermomicrobiales bacterium]|uniref:Putative periplasmic membrane protein n=1 Tax=uncultured Thermomicrobiales bacterium TaxID=1645740 RepID=A0A6J4VEJ2_9BACT|nr:MAG: putative periplasmic membrane protein [uncultured Thermomicrobiales bacterium]